MPQLNEDGLIPGQPVDFATIQRVERSRKNQGEQEKPVRTRKTKPEPTEAS